VLLIKADSLRDTVHTKYTNTTFDYIHGKVSTHIENGTLHSSLKGANPLVGNSAEIIHEPRIKRWMGHVARMGERSICGFGVKT
jgi:hypothetical protein